MKVINVELSVKPGMQKDYEAFIDELVNGSRGEAGNVSYNHFKNCTAIPTMKSLNIGKMPMQLNFTMKPLISRSFLPESAIF